MRLFQRESRDCRKGSQWYTCNSNGFKGCCSVDACKLPGCPDQGPLTQALTTVTLAIQGSEPTSTISTAITASAESLSRIPLSSSSASTTSSSSSAATIASQVTSSSSAVEHAAGISSSSVVPAPTGTGVSESSSLSRSTTPIIAGTVAGVVAVSIAAVLVWFCLRRRRNQRLSASSSTATFGEGKDLYMLESNLDEEQRLEPNDVFAPFGGYHKTPSVQERSMSNNSTSSQQTLHPEPVTQSLQDDVEDAPLPDTEKSSVRPPPMAEHPALHPLPGQSPEVPAYHPGRAVTSPELALHPSYLSKHPSLISQHPALRSSKTEPTSSASRPYSKSHPAVKPGQSRPSKSHVAENLAADALSSLPSQKRNRKHSISRTSSIHSPNNPPFRPSYSPAQTLPRLDSVKESKAPKPLLKPLSVQALEPSLRFLPRHSSLPITNAEITSLVPGRSELPAEVPEHCISPPQPQELGGDDKDWHVVTRGSSTNTTATQASTYSIPIGLGVDPPRHTSPLEPVIERTPISEPARSPQYLVSPPTRSPLYPISAVSSPGSLSPQFHPSPRSAVSPDTRSPQHLQESAAYIVSPQIPSAPFHSSPLPPPKYPCPTSPLPSPPPPRSPPRPKINTTIIPKPEGPQSRSPILRSKNRARPSLGKGQEHVMAWATYRYHSGTGTSSGNITPISRKSVFSSSHTKLPQSEQDVEAESPVFEKQPRRKSGYGKVSSTGDEVEGERESEMDITELNDRLGEGEERWSGSTVAMSISAPRSQEKEEAVIGPGFGVHVQTSLNQPYGADWPVKEAWSGKPF